MAHDHSDHTHHANTKTMSISFIIITVYMVVEAIGGYVTNSLALLSDAGHMLSDSYPWGLPRSHLSSGRRQLHIAIHSATSGLRSSQPP